MPNAATPSVSELVSQAVKDSSALTGSEAEQVQADQAAGEEQLPEFMKGTIKEEEWSGLPSGARQKLTELGKSLYSDYQHKTQSVAREREQLEELKGRMEETLKEALSKQQLPQVRQEARDFFDELMSQSSDPAAREQLSKLKSGILQLTKADEIQRKLDQLEKMLSQFVQTTQVSRSSELKSSLTKFSDAYQPLIQKYEKQVIDLGVQYPNLSPRKLLQLVATEDEYDQAVQADGVKQTKKSMERTKEVVGSKPQSTVGTLAATERDKLPSKTPKLYGSRWNIRNLIERSVPEVRAGTPS